MRREITITILLAIVVVALILGMKLATGSVEEKDARKLVTEDLKTRFPDADKIEIVKFEQRTNENGQQYYAIKAAVGMDLATACPTRTNYYYDYPAQNFVSAPPERIVSGCKVCESRPCIIAFEEEAIIASHTLPGAEEVHAFVMVAKDEVPHVNRTAEGWNVFWTSEMLNYSYNVGVSDIGEIIGLERQ